jgi:hypothetical protein
MDTFVSIRGIATYSADCSLVDNGGDSSVARDGDPVLGNVVRKMHFRASNIDKRIGIVGCFHLSESIGERLTQLAAMTAGCCDADICLVLLFEREEPSAIRFNVYSGHRTLPPMVHARWVERAEAIARKAIAADTPLGNKDSVASRPGAMGETTELRACMVASPIRIDGRTIGYVNVADERDSWLFNAEDRGLMDTVSWLVGQSLKAAQLESVLSSQFAQMAVAQEARHTVVDALAVASQKPGLLSKILAKAFYREMVRLGLDSAHIINAASEIITQISENLQKHKDRNRRDNKRT